MASMWNWLRGKKTYFLALAIGVVVVLHQLGVLDVDTYNTLLGLLGAGGLAAVRNGMDSKTKKK